ncbi:sterol desaturase family protein [Acidianus sp. HS-5]|uniref:sterol desaturase family protein n=1 Tax=Acidianus sp. HS-5 TaxID=2886040 RepID=UPI001F3E52AF|nr:sterol desaturase family protein [Acidianus sp. HS-5]BDC17342.1 beta-carotene hydroxylase [Acidianus sp. HS-5]
MLTVELIALSVAVFFGMEFLARLMHKYLMHGILWKIHEDHHRPVQREIEKNDAFGLIFAGISVYLIFYWLIYGNLIALSVALGMTAYGVAYFFVHDMVIHNRHLHLRSWGMRHKFLRELILVHDVHHKEGRGNWGFLLVIKGIDKIPEEVKGERR